MDGTAKQDATAKSNDAGFRMDFEKDEVRKIETAALCGDSRKVTNFGLSRAAERQVGSFGSRVKQH